MSHALHSCGVADHPNGRLKWKWRGRMRVSVNYWNRRTGRGAKSVSKIGSKHFGPIHASVRPADPNRSAATEVLSELADANRIYYERFGFIFIICASGKGAGEVLAALRSRLNNNRETELRNAAEQQRLITRLRLAKLAAP